MRQSYRVPETDEKILALAVNLVTVIVDSGVTFQQASDALTAAQDMLFTKYRPVIG